MDENRNKLYQVEDTIWVYCLHTKKNFKLVVSSFRTKNLYCFLSTKKRHIVYKNHIPKKEYNSINYTRYPFSKTMQITSITNYHRELVRKKSSIG